MRRAKLALVWAVLLLALAGVVSACGGGTSTGSQATTSGASGEGGKAPGLAAAEAKLQKLYKGTFGQPPSTSPTPPKNQSIWIISCGQAVTGCSVPAAAEKEAVESLGWKATVWDTKQDPNEMLAGIRQAITAKADGITGFAIDCPTIEAALQEAKAAGIPYVAAESFDCSDLKKGAPSLFTSVVAYNGIPYVDWIKSYGAAQATWNIVKTGGEAKTIEFFENDTAALRAIAAGFDEEMETCGRCEIADTVTFTFAALGPELQEKTQQAMLEHPDANTIQVGYDALLTSGITAGLRASGHLGQMQIMGAEGAPPNLEMIREENGQDAGVGTPPAWEGYAAIDALVRILAGKKPTMKTGLGLQVFDREHNLPASGPYVPIGQNGKPIDFAKDYQEAWRKGEGG
ncbi:MAG: substrate-binding domain-containing protein [Actinobacteria bacterium]|nr:substrate-binding domain-containing protein [Actinomycetota bacterium]